MVYSVIWLIASVTAMRRSLTRATLCMAVVLTFAGLLLSCGDYQPVTKPQSCCAPAPISLPLHVQGQWIVDANNRRVKLTGVNWYGAEEQDHVVAALEIAHLKPKPPKNKALPFNVLTRP